MHGRHLVPGEVTGVHVGADDGGGDAGVILQLCQDGPLLGLGVDALHGGQDLGLLALRHTPEAHSCGGEEERVSGSPSLARKTAYHSRVIFNPCSVIYNTRFRSK